ncbi:tyrosine protein phosphatase yvh1, partial [Linderina pennispora]
SRSATVALAYIMQKDDVGRDEALEAMKARRPQVHPNPGFMDQLELYHDLRYEVTPSKPLYRRFLINHSAEHFREYGSVERVELGADPLAQPMPAQRQWRCKKCRRPLVTEANVLEHQPGPGQVAFSWNKRNASGVDTPHAFPQNRACSSLFIEPMAWMEGVDAGLVENKVCCPKCDAKLGAFNWAGAQCSCGKWVTPSFQIHRNRVDEVRQNPLLPRRLH